jgi:enamine deaminase RidA (YjgF/YER057c/UK114 family)
MESFITLKSQRGINPDTQILVAEPIKRVQQIFRNLKKFTEDSNTNVKEVVRLVVFVADMARDRPIVNKIQKELWGDVGPFPCRTIVEVDYLGDDFIEIDFTLRVPAIDSVPLEFLSPEGSFSPTGTWSLGLKSDNCVFVSGMRGISPADNKLVTGEAPRTRQALENLKLIINSVGFDFSQAISIVIYVTDERFLEMVEMLIKKYWQNKPLPPMEVHIVTSLNDNDIIEIETTFSR